ncbi:MAG: methyltransferase domain-containing protein [Candidatus Binataceae bacterium]
MTPRNVSVLERSLAACDPHGRALLSEGKSDDAVYRMVAAKLQALGSGAGVLLDVGCGSGALRPYVASLCERYVGVDLVRYDLFPAECEFHQANLDRELPLAESFADVVVAAEIIEHLENPRALIRELVRVSKPGGWVVVTTPNQLNLRSLLTLIVRRRFAAFQDVDYPAHLTALLEVDLLRMASEVGLTDVTVQYTGHGIIPTSARCYPEALSRLWPRALSDNLLVAGRKPS